MGIFSSNLALTYHRLQNVPSSFRNNFFSDSQNSLSSYSGHFFFVSFISSFPSFYPRHLILHSFNQEVTFFLQIIHKFTILTQDSPDLSTHIPQCLMGLTNHTYVKHKLQPFPQSLDPFPVITSLSDTF